MLPDSFKAGLATAFFTFISLFGLSLVGWLTKVSEWASSDEVVAFPDGSGLAKAAASAAVAAIIGLVNIAVRYSQDKTGLGPETPDYSPPG